MNTYEVRWAYSFWGDGDKLGIEKFTSLWDAYEYARDTADIDTWSGLFVIRGNECIKVCMDMLGKRREHMWKYSEYLLRQQRKGRV